VFSELYHEDGAVIKRCVCSHERTINISRVKWRWRLDDFV